MKKILSFLAAFVLLFAAAGVSLGESADNSDHTLIIGVSNPALTDARFEYCFLNQYPDGRIIYLQMNAMSSDNLQMLSGNVPDLMTVTDYSLERYLDLDMFEGLDEHVFPSGYPETLAPQAEHLCMKNGRFAGMLHSCTLLRWKMDPEVARILGFQRPSDTWTWSDFITDYFQPFESRRNDANAPNLRLMQVGAYFDESGNCFLPKIASGWMNEVIHLHMKEPDYFLSDAFVSILETTKLLSNDDAIVSGYNEDGTIMNELSAVLFEPYGSYAGAYLSSGDPVGQIPPPRTEEEQQMNLCANVGYLCLLRNAPNLAFARECLQMMGTEEYQQYCSGPEGCAGAKEPRHRVAYLKDAFAEVQYSDVYHTNIRIVDASSLNQYRITELAPDPEKYAERLNLLATSDTVLYNHQAYMEIKRNVLYPALKEFFRDQITADEVARLLYQRIRQAVME